ncbi:MAG: Integral rane protein TerC [Bacteroidetes bacterium]|nr:Integral rane protein TerC [Bacteroidota bacterium]
MSSGVLPWVLFGLLVIALLALDLGVAHRRAHKIKIREALIWTVVWISLALLFNVGIYLWHGSEQALSFLTAYVIEKSLSVDNLFVFVLIFAYFGVEAKYQHKVLFYGIVGALVMRAIFIGVGVTLIHMFHWVIYVFGAFLIVTGFRMGLQKDREVHPQKNPVVKLFRRLMPVTQDYVDGKFLVKRDGRTLATPLMVVLLVIETTDIVFAVDSIPAVLAVSTDPFIVYTSNIFAILGLRALYFALAGAMSLFHKLHVGLAFILVFIGVKMVLADVVKIPIGIALGVVGGILVVSIAASLIFPAPDSSTKPGADGITKR